MLLQHSSLVGTRREYSVEYAVFGSSSYSNYFVRFNYKPNITKRNRILNNRTKVLKQKAKTLLPFNIRILCMKL
uniref:Uncharacterized protein n=1 Tax=Heterorhabditis bacteriophora TaxID=37862 RepID=A0A1I7WK70_HETBA